MLTSLRSSRMSLLTYLPTYILTYLHAHLSAQLVSVVQCAHAIGIVHRDLKLENVLLCGEPGVPDARHVRLIDWGLAHQHALDADGR